MRPVRGACPIPRLPAAWSQRQSICAAGLVAGCRLGRTSDAIISRLRERSAPAAGPSPRAGRSSVQRRLAPRWRDTCRISQGLELPDGTRAWPFFEQHFLPWRISRLGDAEGLCHGDYEPIIDATRNPRTSYTMCGLSRPVKPVVRGTNQSSAGLPHKGQVYRTDRAPPQASAIFTTRREIEDAARRRPRPWNCWLRNRPPLFSQIQGSRVSSAMGRRDAADQL